MLETPPVRHALAVVERVNAPLLSLGKKSRDDVLRTGCRVEQELVFRHVSVVHDRDILDAFETFDQALDGSSRGILELADLS